MRQYMKLLKHGKRNGDTVVPPLNLLVKLFDAMHHFLKYRSQRK